tara:strand:- start:9895 stop:10950 length:1056 start_codon:yes stop_codon:yes gene_type:complete
MNKIKIKSKIKSYEIIFKKVNKFKNEDNLIYFIDYNFFKKNSFLFSRKLKKILIVANEKTKSFENLNKIFDKFFKLNPNRSTTLMCIGGGVLQDISAFIASITFRGLSWIFYPTTLLAQGDSCIGGKTSINYKGSKNQIGNFYPPRKIFIDTNFLNTLKKSDILSGYGEMAHYYLQSSFKEQLFFKKRTEEILNNKKLNLKKTIKNCLGIKKKFIELDEFDDGKRLLLNYGHSFGHALEKYKNYKIPHGLAVSIGLDLANYISYKKKYLDKKNYLFMKNILTSINKKIFIKNFDILKFLNYLEKDKKNTQNHFGVILTRGPKKTFFSKINKKDKNFQKLIKEYFYKKEMNK